MSSSGDFTSEQILTRSKKAGIENLDEYKILKNVSEDQVEVKALLQDQIYHKFVNKIVNPDQAVMKDETLDEDEFVPDDDSLVEAEDGGSSEDELDELDNIVDLEEIERVCNESNISPIEFLNGVPPAMRGAYKKRFPNFWRTHQSLTVHSGVGYEQEDDPDFALTADKAQEDKDQVESGSSSSEESDYDEEEEEMSKEEYAKEIIDLSSMVEDMVIPDDSVVEVTDQDDQDGIDEQEDAEEDDDEDDNSSQPSSKGPTIAELIDEKNDGIYDDDAEYQPVEVEDCDILSSSDDSYVSAHEDSEDSDIEDAEDSDEESGTEERGQQEAMDE